LLNKPKELYNVGVIKFDNLDTMNYSFNLELTVAFILFLSGISLTSCDPMACTSCDGHSEDLSFYRNIDNTTDILFRNSEDEQITFRFVEDLNNIPSIQCDDGIESSDVPCIYEEDFHYSSDELDIRFLERVNTIIKPWQERIIKKAYAEYTIKADSSSFSIGNYFSIDSTHLDLLVELDVPSPVIDTLSNNLITYYDVFAHKISEVRDIENRSYVPTNVFTALYIKPGTGLIGFRLLDDDLFLRQ
jgi:hypothetical protein